MVSIPSRSRLRLTTVSNPAGSCRSDLLVIQSWSRSPDLARKLPTHSSLSS